MSDADRDMSTSSAGASADAPFRVVVAGGGVAGAEGLLALRELAGDRVQLTLVADTDELVLPALSVAEPFSLGHATRVPITALTQRAAAQLVRGSVVSVAADRHAVQLDDGTELEYEALLLAVGARPVERVPHATTWWPRGNDEAFQELLRDLEDGYSKRVAFVIPPGAVWPLPLYELALMTAREVAGMGIGDAELTVITPEANPLALFGEAATRAVREELARAGVRLETATSARVERDPQLQVELRPSGRRLDVQRVVALPGVEGPALPGTTQDDAGFIRVARHGLMLGSDSVWAAGDAIAYPVKYGGISTHQADTAAADIAARAGADRARPDSVLPVLRGVLMTGGVPRELGAEPSRPAGPSAPIWRPTGKVFGTYLTAFLQEQSVEPAAEREPPDEAPQESVLEVTLVLPEPESSGSGDFSPFGAGAEHEQLRRLGHEIREYEDRHP